MFDKQAQFFLLHAPIKTGINEKFRCINQHSDEAKQKSKLFSTFSFILLQTEKKLEIALFYRSKENKTKEENETREEEKNFMQ